MGSKAPTALLSKSSENRQQLLTGDVVNRSQSGRPLVTEGMRAPQARKSNGGELKANQTGAVPPAQLSLVVPSLTFGTLDTPNQGQSDLHPPKPATSQDALESVGDEYLDLVNQSAGFASFSANPGNRSGNLDREALSGSHSPVPAIQQGFSVAANRAETPVVAPEKADLQAGARALSEPSTSGREAAGRGSNETGIAPQNEGAASDFSGVASRNQTDSIASSGLEARAKVAGGGAFFAQAGAARPQTHGSEGVSIKVADHPDQAGSPADPAGSVDNNPFSIGSPASVVSQSMPPTSGMRISQDMMPAIATAGDPSTVLPQISAPASLLNGEPQLSELNDSQSIHESPGAMKPGTGKTARIQIPAAQGSGSGEPASSAFALHATAATASVTGSDAFGLARDPSSVQAANGTAAGVGTSPAQAQGASTTHQTFAALDNLDLSPTLNWAHAGTRHAEAGFEDPALGWIGVRADQIGGGVHAIVVPATAEAALALGPQMAGLNAHLAESHTPLASLFLGSTGGAEGGAGSDQSFNQSAGQNHAQSNSQDAHISPTEGIGARTSVVSAARPAQEILPGLLEHQANHISVMA
jgi:hypothetical protein